MYQACLFHESFSRNAKFLGAGCFSSVYEMSNGTVVKVGCNDMTRNWLEFCQLHTAAGILKNFMPEVYSVVGIEENMYTATMKKYSPFVEDENPQHTDVCAINTCHDIRLVEEEFSEYLRVVGYIYECGDRVFNDLHSGNVMFTDDRAIVITDPSSARYWSMSYRPEFTLQ